jgi:hypothetical protein
MGVVVFKYSNYPRGRAGRGLSIAWLEVDIDFVSGGPFTAAYLGDNDLRIAPVAQIRHLISKRAFPA